MTSETLRAFMEGRNEADYLLVDVRQPAEYGAGHIPGAMFLPLLEFEARLFSLPGDRDLVFYCHSGGRSLAAASLAVEAEVTVRDVYNLEGGILSWEGRKLADFPRVQVIEQEAGIEAMLFKAMELEKGAWRFYRAAMEKAAGHPVYPTLSRLSEAETAHARAVYKHWAPISGDARPFEEVFSALSGEIMEGGQPLSEALDRIEALSGDWCLNLIELALSIEYSAYDLYRTVAEKHDDIRAKNAFLAISQAEKAHMRSLTKAIVDCEHPAGA